jgi:hypothetical protein
MKKRMFKGSHFLLPICLSLAMGLTSCEKDEIIALEEDDLIGDIIDAPPLDKTNATGIILNANGIVGYLNEETDEFIYADNASNLTGRRGGGGTTAPPKFFVGTLYKTDGLKGKSLSVFIEEPDVNFSGTTSYDIDDLGATSLGSFYYGSYAVASNCRLRIYSEKNQSGMSLSFGSTSSDTPEFSSQNRFFLDDNLRYVESARITCSPEAFAEDRYCGYANVESPRRGFTPPSLPILKNYDYNLSDNVFRSYWNDRIQRVISNDDSNCKGIMLYDHITDLTQEHHWVDPDENVTDVMTHVPGVSRILQSHLGTHDYAKVDFNVGAVYFSEDNFEGYPTITHTDYYKENEKSALPINSLVVSPNCTVKFTNSSYTSSNPLGPGYYNKYDLPFDDILAISVSCSSGRLGFSNKYCGTAFTGLAETGSAIPIFSGLNNMSDEDDFLLPGLITDPTVSSFTTPSPLIDTSCKGIAFWSDDISRLNSRREWVSIKEGLTTNFDSPYSAITTEACTSGLTDAEINDMIDTYNTMMQAHSTVSRKTSSSLTSKIDFASAKGLAVFVLINRHTMAAIGSLVSGAFVHYYPDNYYAKSADETFCALNWLNLIADGSIATTQAFRLLIQNHQFRDIAAIATTGFKLDGTSFTTVSPGLDNNSNDKPWGMLLSKYVASPGGNEASGYNSLSSIFNAQDYDVYTNMIKYFFGPDYSNPNLNFRTEGFYGGAAGKAAAALLHQFHLNLLTDQKNAINVWISITGGLVSPGVWLYDNFNLTSATEFISVQGARFIPVSGTTENERLLQLSNHSQAGTVPNLRGSN